MAYDPNAALTSLLTRKQNIQTWLASLAVGVIPDLPQSEGAGNINWPEWIAKKETELAALNALIAIEQGPFEILQQGMT